MAILFWNGHSDCRSALLVSSWTDSVTYQISGRDGWVGNGALNQSHEQSMTWPIFWCLYPESTYIPQRMARFLDLSLSEMDRFTTPTSAPSSENAPKDMPSAANRADSLYWRLLIDCRENSPAVSPNAAPCSARLMPSGIDSTVYPLASAILPSP